jgi:hypothetical protein
MLQTHKPNYLNNFFLLKIKLKSITADSPNTIPASTDCR